MHVNVKINNFLYVVIELICYRRKRNKKHTFISHKTANRFKKETERERKSGKKPLAKRKEKPVDEQVCETILSKRVNMQHHQHHSL